MKFDENKIFIPKLRVLKLKKNDIRKHQMSRKNITGTMISLFALFLILFTTANAQQNLKSLANSKASKENNNTPGWHKAVRISPKASITETIGITDVTISYSRPGVKGRKIWGDLVPYNKVWRAGANEATEIIFSGDVLINGKKLRAGSYGFFVIPREKNWTIIFNKVADQWGAFEYNESEDALRLNVTPQTSNFHEWLDYTLENMVVNQHGKNSAVVCLNWDKIKVPFTVEADVK